MATQIKLAQKDGMECIQINSGFRHKILLKKPVWPAILEWFGFYSFLVDAIL